MKNKQRETLEELLNRNCVFRGNNAQLVVVADATEYVVSRSYLEHAFPGLLTREVLAVINNYVTVYGTETVKIILEDDKDDDNGNIY